MTHFKFLGNPTDYRWDFPLQQKQVYSGDTVAMDGNTIADLMDNLDPKFDQEFMQDWEEVNNV